MPPSRVRVKQIGIKPRAFKILRALLIIGVDFVGVCLIGVWLFGGIRWNGHHYLTHGADLRRAAVLWWMVAYLGIPAWRVQSPLFKAFSYGRDRLGEAWVQWTVLILACLWAILISVQQCLALRVPLYDVGIFHQICWSLTHGLGFHSTISGAGNFLADHFSPSLAVLTPFFALADASPLFLPVVQPILLFGGAAAWLYLGSKWGDFHPLSCRFRQDLTAAITLFIISFDSIWKNIGWGFHENALGFLGFSWAVALILSPQGESDSDQPSHEKVEWKSGWKAALRSILIFLLLILGSFSKEILLVDGAFLMGCWALASSQCQSRLLGLKLRRILVLASALASAVLIGCFFYFETSPHPADKNYFQRYYSYLGSDLKAFLHSLLVSPLLIFKTIGVGELIKYGWTVFSPWLFLPLLLWRRNQGGQRVEKVFLLAIVPSLGSAALATYYALRRSEFHYVLELWPVLGCLTVVALVKFKSSRLIWAWALLALLRMDYDPVGGLREYRREAEKMAAVRAAMQSIPLEASVVADELTGPWLAGRKWVTRYPSTLLLPERCPEILLVRDLSSTDVSRLGCEVHLRWRANGWAEYRAKLGPIP